MRRCRPLLGTFVEVECDRPEAIDGAFAEIGRVHRLMSAHDPDSDLGRINRFAHLMPVRVDSETATVLRCALEWYRRSGGAFDVVRAGGLAIEQGTLSRHSDQPVPQATDADALLLDGDLVRLDRPACVDLGGIAKGHAVDLAVAVLQRAGASTGLVNAGGDLRAFGGRTRSVTVVEPGLRRGRVEVDLKDGALATSAGLPHGDTLSFAHLITNQARWTSVTVRAPGALAADVLAKIVWAMGHQAAGLLREAGAQAFAMRSGGSVEPVDGKALAA